MNTNDINVNITEVEAHQLLSRLNIEPVSLETVRLFLWRQKDRIESAIKIFAGLSLRVIADKEKLILADEFPDPVAELLRVTRALTSLAGHNPQASLATLQYEFNELSRAADKVQLHQEWAYGI